MAYDEELAGRVREALAEHGPREQKMFGGIAWMVNTHMAAGVIGSDLLARVGPEGHQDALARGAGEMTMGGRTMRGFVQVPPALLEDDGLADWLGIGVRFALSQPPKGS